MREIAVDVDPLQRLAMLDNEERGAPTFILLHGAGMNAAAWAPLMEELRPSHCLAVDRRGWGRSSPAKVFAPEAQVEDVAAVMRMIDGEATVLVGQSVGANLALLAATQLSTDAVVAIEPTTVLETADALRLRPRPDVEERIAAGRSSSFGTIVSTEEAEAWLQRADAARSDEWPLGAARRMLERRLHPVDSERWLIRPTVEEVEAEDEAWRTDPVGIEVLGQIDAPVLLLYGSESRLSMHRDKIDGVVASHPNVRAEFVANVAHAPHLEAPSVTGDLIRQFLDLGS